MGKRELVFYYISIFSLDRRGLFYGISPREPDTLGSHLGEPPAGSTLRKHPHEPPHRADPRSHL